MGIERVGVVGCGLMGSGIAEVSARAGKDVVVLEGTEDLAAAGRQRVEKSLRKAESRGKLGDDTADAVLQRVRVVSDIAELADREIVIEAASENEKIKLELFASLDEVVESPEAVLASNTSSFPITKLSVATSRPERVIGLHFFNPVPVLKLVEVIPGMLTADDTVERARTFARDDLGKQPIDAKDRAGFVVNALLVPFILSAIRMLETGQATAEDIDTGLVLGAAHPQGPLALADLVGLDTVKAIADSLHAEFHDPQYAAPPMLVRMVEAGRLGRKSGRGFHDYDAS